MKRNNVNLHENVLALLQNREEERKERALLMKMLAELREEVKVLVIK